LKEPGRDPAPERAGEDADQPFDPVVQAVEERILQKSALPVHRRPTEPVAPQQLAHLAIAPFLEVKTLEGIPKMNRDIVRAGETMRRVEDVDASRTEEPVHGFEVKGNIIGVEVLEELVAEGKVAAAIGQIELVAIVDDQFEILRENFSRRALVGDVDAVDALAPLCRRSAESAIAGGDLDEDGFGSRLGKMRAKETHLRLQIFPGGLRGFPAGEARVVLDPVKKLGVECLEQRGALLSAGGAEPRGEFALHLEVVTKALERSGISVRFHSAGEVGDRSLLRIAS